MIAVERHGIAAVRREVVRDSRCPYPVVDWDTTGDERHPARTDMVRVLTASRKRYHHTRQAQPIAPLVGS